MARGHLLVGFHLLGLVEGALTVANLAFPGNKPASETRDQLLSRVSSPRAL